MAGLSMIAGCSDGQGSADTTQRLDVFAASSLRVTFSELAELFEARHPGVDVVLTVGGSSDLATQVAEGAPADVLAAADERAVAGLAEAGLLAGPAEIFATNTLTVVTPPGNPADVTGLADLARPELAVVVCAPQVPCGAAAQRLASRVGVTLAPRSEEPSVVDVLAKVVSGEADAGLVYVTDALGAGDAVGRVPVPDAGEVVNRYPVAVLAGTDQRDLAVAFRDLVTGPDGRRVLTDAGFGTPPALPNG